MVVTGLTDVMGHIAVMMAADYAHMDRLTLDGILNAFHGQGMTHGRSVPYVRVFTESTLRMQPAAKVSEVSVMTTGSGGDLLDEIADTITTGLSAFIDVEEFRTCILTNVANVVPDAAPHLNEYIARQLRNATRRGA